MSIIWPPSFSPSVSLKNTRIGYQSWAFDRPASAVTVSGETADGPKDSPLRPDTAEFWEPDVLPATWQLDFGAERALDYIGIAAHTLGSSGCTVRVENSYLPFPSFSLPLNDRGGSPQGEVDLSLLRGSGGATFTRATIATTVGPTGLVVHVGAGVPRSYYDPTTLEYMGYLAEGQRTNLALRSEELDNASWTKNLSSITANDIASPHGGQTADRMTENAGTGEHNVEQSISVTSGTSYAMSAFFKKGTKRYMVLSMSISTNYPQVKIDLDSASATEVFDPDGNMDSNSIVMKPYPNGWYRVSATVVPSASGTAAFKCGFLDDTGVTANYAAGSPQGYGYVWGAQFEAGAFASSYIPTTTASVTRNGDVLQYTFSGNADATQGTCYAELGTEWTNPTGGNNVAINFGETIGPLLVNNQAATAIICFDGTNAAEIAGLTSMHTGSRRRASSWGASGLRVTGDGVVPQTGSFDGNIGATAIAIGHTTPSVSTPWFGMIKNVNIWTSQLTNAQLQLITAAGEEVGSPPETYEFDPPWEIFSEEVTPADDAPLLFLDSSRSAQYIRVTITGGADIPRVGVIFAGEVLEMERAIRGGGHAPPNLMRETVLHRSLSRGGQFLGQGFRRNGLTASESFQHLDPTWYRENFDPFVEHARSKPFFFAWRPEEYPDEVAYCWCPDDIHPTYMGIRDLMQVSLNLRGFAD